MRHTLLLNPLLHLTLAVLLLIPFYSHANSTITTDMKSIHKTMESLFPLALKQKNLNTAEMNLIINNVNSLKNHVGHLKSISSNKSDSFKISNELLISQLDHIQAALKNKEDQYALSMIREIPQMCNACHTQDEQTMHFDSSSIKEKLKSDFLRGEYHFMTRDYQEALLDYNDHLAKQKKIQHENNNAEALEKILLIYIQVLRDTDSARIYFKRLLDSEKLNVGLAIDVNYWVESLEKIKYGPSDIKNIEELETKVHSVLKFKDNSDLPIFIDSENKADALWVRALVYDFMNREPKQDDSAKLLYWLASLESALDFGLSYQLPEVYLKHCIVTYPKDPYAKKCYSQYRLQMEFNYTGSSGTHLPYYKKLELESLEKIIQ